MNCLTIKFDGSPEEKKASEKEAIKFLDSPNEIRRVVRKLEKSSITIYYNQIKKKFASESMFNLVGSLLALQPTYGTVLIFGDLQKYGDNANIKINTIMSNLSKDVNHATSVNRNPFLRKMLTEIGKPLMEKFTQTH